MLYMPGNAWMGIKESLRRKIIYGVRYLNDMINIKSQNILVHKNNQHYLKVQQLEEKVTEESNDGFYLFQYEKVC